ncbi:MAG TPA: enoyl-CoA hydratase-related protein, partial [Myxococcota bacterium]|nr:enoyl-CoA hydratase-related protein [Myxococcota bacterium]
KLGIPEVGVGLFAAGGALIRLPRRLPYAVAMEMALTAQPMLAEQAHAHGLVSRLCEPGEAVACALELAEQIAKNAPLGIAASKQLIRANQGRTEAELWALQEPLAARVLGSKDAREGALAFIQKRAPNWQGE